MKCAYCGEERKASKEHIISSSILDLFPECYITFDEARNSIYESDPVVKDVCEVCNNQKLSYIDSYAKMLISKYFTKKYNNTDAVAMDYDYVMIQKMLLKYAYNDMRSHKMDCSYFDEEILHYLMNESDNKSKKYISVLGGLAVNVSPIPDAMMGNLKLRWCKDPIFYSNSTVRHINYETGQIILNEDVKKETFDGLKLSYLFKFNSVQFLLMCWDRNLEKVEQNNIVLECQYPYSLLREDSKTVELRICTDEINYHRFEHIHVTWDLLHEVGAIRKYASGGTYDYKNRVEEEWLKEEKKIADEHPRDK